LNLIEDPPYELDYEVYEMMRMDTTKELYEMENLGRFPIENVGFFSARLIDSCTPRRTEFRLDCPIEILGEPQFYYAMGIDAARVAGGDNFAITIVKLVGKVKQIVHVFTANGISYQEMIFHIRRLMQAFPNLVQISCDSGGGGTTIKDLLSQSFKTMMGEVLPPILDKDDKDLLGKQGLFLLRMMNFTRPVVNDLYMRLKADMQHRNLEFPIDIRRCSDRELEKIANDLLETKRELLVLQAEGKGNYYTFDVPSQFKKDRATSLVLANQAANDFLDELKVSVKFELPLGSWVKR